LKHVAKKKRHTADAGPSTEKHRCASHPDRMPAASREGVELCWECLLPKKEFERKCDKDYYLPGGPGYAD